MILAVGEGLPQGLAQATGTMSPIMQMQALWTGGARQGWPGAGTRTPSLPQALPNLAASGEPALKGLGGRTRTGCLQVLPLGGCPSTRGTRSCLSACRGAQGALGAGPTTAAYRGAVAAFQGPRVVVPPAHGMRLALAPTPSLSQT